MKMHLLLKNGWLTKIIGGIQLSLILEEENFLTQEEILFVDQEILSHRVPWHYDKESTSEIFPFFKHVIIPRRENPNDPIEITSPLYEFFTNIQIRFCEKNRIKINRLYRQCLNLSFPNPEYELGDPHVDHVQVHKNIIIYLNDDFEKGETIIFNKKNNNNTPSILKEIIPKKGKVVCFDGDLFHTVRWIPKGRRIIFVSTFD